MYFFMYKKKTQYELRISDWSSDVCSSDLEAGSIDGKVYAVSKNWGTTGYAVNTAKVTEKMTSWKQFWDLNMEKYSGRTMVHDYQLTRSEERRVGTEGVSTCRSRRSPYQKTTKNTDTKQH